MNHPIHPEEQVFGGMVRGRDVPEPVPARTLAIVDAHHAKLNEALDAKDAEIARLTVVVPVAAQPVQPADKALKSAREVGEKGAPHSESERLLFDEYMRGHNWKCDSWNADKSEYADTQQRILYAVFRARAAIAQPAVPVTDAEVFAACANSYLFVTPESIKDMRHVLEKFLSSRGQA